MSGAVRRRAPRRVLMTTDAVGGVWTYSLDLARGLARAGVETMLVVLGPSPTPDQAAEAYAVPRLALIDTGLPMDWIAGEPAEVLEIGAAVRGLARGGRADLIHLNSPAVAAQGGFAHPVVGACHSCLATWWSTVKDGPMPSDFRWRTQMLWQGLLACDALVAPSRAFAEQTGLTYELPAPEVVWNGREASDAGAPVEREPVVLSAGRLWDEGKDVGTLDAAAGLSAVKVEAAGPLTGPVGQTVELSHARALGRLSAAEMRARLRRAAVFATAARYEPFGLGVLEAAQAGCALVLSDIPTFRELWDGAAVFVPPQDAAAFARAFDRLIADPAERATLAARAKARSAAYSVEAMSAGMLEVYARAQSRTARAVRTEAVA